MKKTNDISCEISNDGVIIPPSLKQIKEYELDTRKIWAAIKDLTLKQINYHINSSEWNIKQVVVHLADTEMFFCQRMRTIIAEQKPNLPSFDQDKWANELFYDKQNYKLAFELLKAQRKSTASLLRLLPPEYWKREGTRDGKTFTLYDIFLTAMRHIPTHLHQINNIKKNLYHSGK